MKTLAISLKMFLLFTILTGILYPFLITEAAQVIFPGKANGSLVLIDGKVAGSSLIGQQFNSERYFISRPSLINYNPIPSAGSNLSLTSTKLRQTVDLRKEEFSSFNKLDSNTVIPSEMLFASASGLDPHISVKAAMLQVERVVQARQFNTNQRSELLNLIKNLTEKPQLLVLGEERVNVFLLNLNIDKIK